LCLRAISLRGRSEGVLGPYLIFLTCLSMLAAEHLPATGRTA
jgi:hypothetical protein